MQTNNAAAMSVTNGAPIQWTAGGQYTTGGGYWQDNVWIQWPYIQYWPSPATMMHCAGDVHVFHCEHCKVCRCGKAKLS